MKNSETIALLIFIGGVALWSTWLTISEYRRKKALKPKPRHLKVIRQKDSCE